MTQAMILTIPGHLKRLIIESILFPEPLQTFRGLAAAIITMTTTMVPMVTIAMMMVAMREVKG